MRQAFVFSLFGDGSYQTAHTTGCRYIECVIGSGNALGSWSSKARVTQGYSMLFLLLIFVNYKNIRPYVYTCA